MARAPTASGLEAGCQPRRSGSTRRVAPRHGSSRGAILRAGARELYPAARRSVRRPVAGRGAGCPHPVRPGGSRWVRIRKGQAGAAPWTWRAMSGSGRQTGGAPDTTAGLRQRTPGDRRAETGHPAEVVGHTGEALGRDGGGWQHRLQGLSLPVARVHPHRVVPNPELHGGGGGHGVGEGSGQGGGEATWPILIFRSTSSSSPAIPPAYRRNPIFPWLFSLSVRSRSLMDFIQADPSGATVANFIWMGFIFSAWTTGGPPSIRTKNTVKAMVIRICDRYTTVSYIKRSSTRCSSSLALS